MPSRDNKGHAKRSRQGLVQLTRETKALELRLQGQSFEEIAQQLKVSVPTATKWVDAALTRISAAEQRDVARLRKEADARALALLAAWWDHAMQPDDEGLQAAGIVLQVLRDLRKLWGLDLVRSPKDDPAFDLIGTITTAWEPISGESMSRVQPEDGAALAPGLPPGIDLQAWESPPAEDGRND